MRRAGLSSKVKGDAARSEVARLQQLFNEVSAQNANAGDVADIDFGAYRNVIKTPGIVDSFESAYKSLSLPTFTAAPSRLNFSSTPSFRGSCAASCSFLRSSK